MAPAMKEVTDPNILAQLNDPSVPGTPMKEVTDPAILSQLNSSAPQQQSSLLSQYMNSPGPQAVLGAGDALRNTVASGLNLLPGVNISPINSGNGGIAYGLGNIAGNFGGFMAGGEALDSARLGMTGAPYIGKAMQAMSDVPGATGLQSFAPQMMRQGIGVGIYGGLTANQNRLQNAGKGAVISAALNTLPYGVGEIAHALQYFMPQKFATNIINTLGNGQTLSDATKSVLADVKNGYDTQVENAKNAYTPIFDSVPNSSIYAPVNQNLSGRLAGTSNFSGMPPAANEAEGIVTPTPLKSANENAANPAPLSNKLGGGLYPSLPQSVIDNYTSGLKDLHNTFINNPTFQNAHKLQSELGSVSAQLKSGVAAPTISTIDASNSLMNARSALKSDINDFLVRQNPDIAAQYQNASQNFQQNVVPYRANPKIYSIATGDTTNVTPASLSGIFKAPDENVTKVLSDMPSRTMDNILYTKLGQTVPNKSAQGLLNSYQNLQQQGLSDYVSPQLSAQIGDLENKIKARNAIQMGTAGLAAATLGGSHLGSAAGAVLGFGAGAVASPFMNYIGRRLPTDKISAAIGNVLRGTYPTAQSAILANTLNKSGGQQ
jgi:hypothetical protein